MRKKLGRNRQKMVDELGHWEDWRDRAAQIRDHVLANLDAYLYQLSEKNRTTWWACFLCSNERMKPSIYSQYCKKRKKSQKNSQSQINGDGRNWLKPLY